MVDAVTRRGVMAALAALSALPSSAVAGEAVVLTWDDLLPAEGEERPEALRGLVNHDAAGLASRQPVSTGVRTDWNGETVSIPGFVVPYRYSGTGLSAFILVPYVGACVHVPPPPANQLVYVTTEEPFVSDGLFAPVTVTGLFGTGQTSTHLAEIGYTLAAERIEPYEW